MSFFVFPIRVNANRYAKAQELVIAQLLERGLEPIDMPNPKRCPVQYGEETLWECYAKCRKVAG